MAFLGNTTRLARRLAAWLTRSRRDDDLREEIEAHIALRTRSLVESGVDPRDAAYEARRLFGNAAAIRQTTRELWSVRWFDNIVQDVRFGARLLLRTPLFTAVAVLSLALGIGAAVAVFTVADAVLFRPLPVRDPQRLHAFELTMRLGGAEKTTNGVALQDVATIQAGADFADFVGFRIADDVALETVDAAPRTTRVEFGTDNYFDVLGVKTRAGRLPGSLEPRGSPAPVVISTRLWREAFNSDAAVMGRTLRLNGHASVVVGVVDRFTGLVADRPADVFAPLSEAEAIEPSLGNVVVMLVGRLRPGVSVAVAEQKLAGLYRVSMPGPVKGADILAALPNASRGVSAARPALERPLWLGLGLVALLVLIACANTAALLLARFVSRQSEFGVRVALGAGRWRMARQLVAEALLVSIAAAATGLLLGWQAAPLLMHAMPETGAQVAFDLRFDARLALFTALLAAVCAAGAVSASLVRVWRSDPLLLLNGDSRSVIVGSRRVTRILVAAQVACSLLLVVGAVSMARTLVNLRRVDTGFDVSRALVVNVNAAGLTDSKSMSAYHARLRERLLSLPAVQRATMTQIGPFASASTSGSVQVPGFTAATDEDRITRVFFVGPEFFDTLGMRIVAGRALMPQDGIGRTRAAVVNERFSTFYFGTPMAALDRTINTDVQVVGIIADAHYNTTRDQPPRAMFVPYEQVQRPAMAHILSVHGDPAAVAGAAREAVAAFDPRLRPRIQTAADLFTQSLARERFFASIAWTLSGLALLLACAGLHAAVAYAVTQRQGELAVRLALGASARDVLATTLRDPLVTTAIGIAAGIPGAYLVLRSAQSLLFGVTTFEPATVAACGAALLAAALLATAWPARRVLTIDPVRVLRNG